MAAAENVSVREMHVMLEIRGNRYKKIILCRVGQKWDKGSHCSHDEIKSCIMFAKIWF